MEQPEATSGQSTSSPAGIMGRVRSSANAQLSQQKDRATDGIGSVAQAVRQSTQQLRDQQHDTIAQYIEQAADQLERLSSRLKEKNVNELVEDAQRFARQRPALFVGSAFAIGLVGARFLKSSSERSEYGSYALSRSGGSETGYAGTHIPTGDYGTAGSGTGYGTTGSSGSYGTTGSSGGYGTTGSRSEYGTPGSTSGFGGTSTSGPGFGDTEKR